MDEPSEVEEEQPAQEPEPDAADVPAEVAEPEAAEPAEAEPVAVATPAAAKPVAVPAEAGLEGAAKPEAGTFEVPKAEKQPPKPGKPLSKVDAPRHLASLSHAKSI